MDIKLYKPLIIIYFRDIDGSIGALTTEAKNRPIIRKSMETARFIELEGVPINVNLIQKIEEPKNDLEEIFYTQPRAFRQQADIKAVKRGFKNYLTELQSMQDPLVRLESAIKSFILEQQTNERSS